MLQNGTGSTYNVPVDIEPKEMNIAQQTKRITHPWQEWRWAAQARQRMPDGCINTAFVKIEAGPARTCNSHKAELSSSASPHKVQRKKQLFVTFIDIMALPEALLGL